MTDVFDRTVNTVKLRQSNVIWHDSSECYAWSKPFVRLAGITSRLRDRFYPRASKPERIKSARVYSKNSGKWIKGRKGGCLIHEELEDFVQNAKNGVLKKDLDPRSGTVIKEVLARKWIIIDAEYCVGDKDLRLGTGIDLLCITENGKIAVVELKIGFDNVIYEGPTQKRMKKPFNMMDDSLYSQHQLQLLATVFLFEKMVGIPVDLAEVWVIGHPQGLDGLCRLREFPLHPSIASQGLILVHTLASTPKTSKKRKYIANVKATERPKKRSYKG